MNILKQSSIIMVLLVIHSRFVSAQWIEVVTGYPFYFTDATFYDELNGVIVGNESLITTHDGGNFWTKLQFDSIDFVEVIFTEDSTMYSIASLSGPSHQILRSVNLGDTWISLNPIPAGSSSIRSINFINPDTGMVAFEHFLYKTIDGGDNWSEIWGSGGFLTWFNLVGQDSIKMLQTNSFNGYIYESTNGGGNWQNLNFNDDLELLFETNDQPIDFSDWNHGHFVFGNYYYSTDGGVSWNGIPYYYDQGEETDFQKIECPSDSVCYVMALNIPYAPIILKLLNHGETIIKTDFPDIGNGGVTSLHCLNDTFCYVTTSNGRLFVTKNGGGVVAITETAQNDFPFSFYPNPAIDQLHLSFNFMQGNKTFATITNLMGVQLLSEPLNASDPVIDISILPPGIYFIGLKTDEGSEVNKFMKQ
ncbi:MAG: T9SS type A sorting domain-containing protein [Chitinophagaceae bacterium]|nr:T9SS type A sorting domain-containing protein [Chitinophagaceae bacterium]